MSPVGVVQGNDAPDPGVITTGARPRVRRITRLSWIGRSFVRFGHTSRRRFGEDAQRFFLKLHVLQKLGVLRTQAADLRFKFFYAEL